MPTIGNGCSQESPSPLAPAAPVTPAALAGTPGRSPSLRVRWRDRGAPGGRRGSLVRALRGCRRRGSAPGRRASRRRSRRRLRTRPRGESEGESETGDDGREGERGRRFHRRILPRIAARAALRPPARAPARRRGPLPVDGRQANFLFVVLETALTDVLHLNWAIPISQLPPAPAGLRYDRSDRGGESLAFFSLVLLRQVGLHLQGASWLALSYPQISARLCVCATPTTRRRCCCCDSSYRDGRCRSDASSLACRFRRRSARFREACRARRPRGSLPADRVERDERTWRWGFSAGARFEWRHRSAGPANRDPRSPGRRGRRRSRSFATARVPSGCAAKPFVGQNPSSPAATFLPVSARIERADWLETFLPFAPSRGWSELHSAFLVPECRSFFAFGSVRATCRWPRRWRPPGESPAERPFVKLP